MKLSSKSSKPQHAISYKCPKCQHAYLSHVFNVYKDRDIWKCEKCETQYALLMKEIEVRE